MRLARSFVLLVMISGNSTAEDVKLAGTITRIIHPINPSVVTVKNARQVAKPANFQPKTIFLLNIELSEQAKQRLIHRAQHSIASFKQGTSDNQAIIDGNYPTQVQLGMNGVPVLEQGWHGTCETFAISAAIDAVLNKGDYVSQLCQLSLGRYLEKSGYTVSGWEGAWGRTILNQIELFGIVSKQQQMTQSCGGISEYPLRGSAPESEMSLADYYRLSEPVAEGRFLWSPVLDIYQAFTDDRIAARDKILHEVKTALRAGDRLVLSVLLVDLEAGTVGAVGTNKVAQDSWVLMPEIIMDLYLRPNFAGHAMVITGYDDQAIATDNKGRQHRGLLTLRSSWGERIGNQGDFYMSYDYFKLFTVEIQRIHSLPTIIA